MFYDLFIRPVEWMFSLNTSYGQMLREAISSFPKATKFVNLMINVVASFYASSDLDHEQLFEELRLRISSLPLVKEKKSINVGI